MYKVCVTDDTINKFDNINDLKVYVYLLGRANKDTHSSFPLQETIANDLDISLRTVKRAIYRLEGGEYISIHKVHSKEGIRLRNVYQVNNFSDKKLISV